MFRQLVYSTQILLLLIHSSSASALSTESLSTSANGQIVEAVTLAIEEKLAVLFKNKEYRAEISVEAIDRRLNFPRCKSPLKVSSKQSHRYQARSSVKVQCPDKKPWGIRVTASSKVYLLVAVASNQLVKGQRIDGVDIDWNEVIAGQLRNGYFTQSKQLIGMELRRNLPANSPFTPKLLRLPIVIKRGDQVTISTKFAALEVKTDGIALNNGTLGQTIHIKNRKSQRVLDAKVIGPGMVVINR